MQRWTLAALVLLLLASSTLGAPPGPPQERDFTLVAMAGGYNGSAPGPLLDVNVGDRIVLTLVNQLDHPVSFHVHGMALSSAMDGIGSHAGTNLVDSTAPPGGSFTYRFRAPYAGLWHYHDHAMVAESASAGYYGTIVVRNGGELRPATAVDAHLLDNKCPGVPATAKAPFELDITALGNELWSVGMTGGLTKTIGPALSARYAASTPGTYTWSAVGYYFGEACGGTVLVT